MKNRSGFILLEIMLSLVILGTVLGVSISALGDYVRSASSSSTENTVAALAQQLIAGTCLNEYKSNLNTGTVENSRMPLSWEVTRQQATDTECRYDIAITWEERGARKKLQLSTTRRELKE